VAGRVELHHQHRSRYRTHSSEPVSCSTPFVRRWSSSSVDGSPIGNLGVGHAAAGNPRSGKPPGARPRADDGGSNRYPRYVLPHERKLREAALALPVPVRRSLLHVLVASPEERATAIRRLWEVSPGGQMAELLIELEQNRLLALDVAEALKGSLS
jgi:hypothetical protein